VSGVVQKVIQDARSSLLLVRAYLNPEGSDAEPTYERLLLPLDGSKRAECILPVAEALARTWDADLLLTHVIPEPQLFPAAPPVAEDQALLARIIDRRQAAASRYFEQLQARLRARSHVYLGVGASVFDAFHEIVDTTAPDLVLFSAHGRGFSPNRPYGRLVTSCILYGCASLLILQDVAPEQLEPTAAQLALEASGTGSARHLDTAPRHEPYLSRVN
jgi:nucleotide-binding universal stress UspA family protein